MTNEDKKLITDYMDWSKDYGYVEEYDSFRELDLNDAGLGVAEMQKRGDWVNFYDYVIDTYNDLIEDGKVICGLDNLTAWLFNAENFFNAMSQWLKERK